MSIPQRKVAFMGPSSVGKTSLVLRASKKEYVQVDAPTIGTGIETILIDTKKGKVQLNVWDTAGQERFRSLVPQYARGSSVIIVVFDMSDEQSFVSAKNIIEHERGNYPDNIKWILVGNKCDLTPQVLELTALTYADKQDIMFFKTSAVNGENVEYLFRAIAECALCENSVDANVDVVSSKKTCC